MTYSAICKRASDGHSVNCQADASNLTFWTPEGPITVPVPTTPMFLSVASLNAWPDFTVAVGKGHDGEFGGKVLVMWADKRFEAIDPGGDIGNQSVWALVNATGDELIIAWVNPGGSSWSLRSARGGDVAVLPSGLPGTSQGWLGVPPVGDPWWTDTHRTQTIGDFTVSLPAIGPLNGWAVGQSNNFYGVAAIDPQGRLWCVRDNAPVQTPPQAVVGPDGQIEVAISFDSGPFVVRQPAFTYVAGPPLIDVPPVDPPSSGVTATVTSKPMFYANGDLKLTTRVPKGGLQPTPKRGQSVIVQGMP